MKKRKEPSWHKFFNVITEEDTEVIKEKVTNKELFLLYLIHKLRCLSPKEVSRLLDNKLNTSLIDLRRTEEKGFLYSEYADFYGCEQRVFFTTNKGIEKTAEILGTKVYRFDKYLDKYVPNFYSQYENKISSNYIPHFLATNDFYLTLLKNEIAVNWKDSRYNALFSGDIRKAPFRVDASYTIGNNFFGVEQDMGTMDKTRSLTKFSTYANYFPIVKFDNATIYFSINMGKYLNPKKLNKLPPKFTENEEVLRELRVKKRKYVEARKLIKEYPALPPMDELIQKKEAIEELLKNPVLSRQEIYRQKKALNKIKEQLSADYPKPEDDLKFYEQAINNPIISEPEKRKARIKKEIILTYKEISQKVDLDKKIKELTLQIRKLNSENNKMKEDKERNMLIEFAHRRRDTVMSYIDFHIKNKEKDNTLLDLFRQGFNMYVDESISLAKFAAKQIKKETVFDYLTKYIEDYIKGWISKTENAIDYNLTKKAKHEYLMFTIDCEIKMFRKNQINNSIYFDFFDICSNNVASTYRFYEYLKTKFDERDFFQNRLAICLIDSVQRIAEAKKKFPHSMENVWFYEGNAHNIDFYNMMFFQEGNLKYLEPSIELGNFLRKVDN